ncbi:hypothetical protein ACFZAM_31245 [Streptomyces sp. NPDC008079]|uniref:hypothetical protein n=1 Tax=Streptomyces sp. NPDC008079 TaxID=3364806 RepID=UPI0036E0D203
MSGSTPRLGLKTFDPSDPFLRADFNDIFTKIDASPGNFICTSATRPAWGAAQAGMRVYEADTRREIVWTGTAWREVLPVPPVWTGWLRPNISMSAGTHVYYKLATFNVNRPGALLVLINSEHSILSTQTMNVNTKAQVDGTDAQVNDQGSYTRETQINASGTALSRNFMVPTIGLRAVGVGSHNFGVHVECSTQVVTTGGSVKLVALQGVAILVNSSDT